ncbi:hypothetical protein FIBSPDRAFT_803285 [Athelia psychrophila]|uniref:MYND-type domain-containing protein n=1 Tax=Athelia psychrophila TaxID=1759441 RepID=A0A165X3Z5_9AGAM|nr:hypothetical protein FIBSPDRAFT_803285 [Fibularhizoctonia sp. CBS 109695]
MSPSDACAVCGKKAEEEHPLFRCTGCNGRFYCGADCQSSDWPAHKKPCKDAPKWYDRFRICDDRGKHEGRLELVTWDCVDDEGDALGWGGCFIEESDDLRKKYEGEFGRDPSKLYEHWPQAFRWTCCGTSADMKHGCDHHGSGSRPCTCDYCRGGKPIPKKLYDEKDTHRMGLNLRRGPDPRSRATGLRSI